MASDNRKKLLDFIKESSRPLIVIPTNSSEDTIGSALALFWAFKNNKKNPRISSSKIIPQNFSFLAGCNFIEKNVSDNFIYEFSLDIGNQEIEKTRFIQSENSVKFCFNSKNCEIKKDTIKFESKSFEYDSIFSIGSPNLKSLGSIYTDSPNIFSNLPIVNIDNHSSNEIFGNINLVISDCVSISEIVARIIQESPDLEIDNEIATLLLAGIIEKTENFQTSFVDSELFYLTAYLLALGAERNKIIKYLYQTNSFAKQDLLFGKLQNLFASQIKKLPKIKNFKDFDRLTPKQVLVVFLIVILAGTILFNARQINKNLAKGALSFSNYNEFLVNTIMNVGPGQYKSEIQTPQENNNIFLINKITETDLPMISLEENNAVQASPKNQKIGTSLIISDAQKKSFPKKLEIPKLKVSSNVENVGLAKDNEMDIPKSDWAVGWFSPGPSPGEIGSAVIAGHLDSQTGKPAVFWNLHKLQAGDYIFITDNSDNKRRFRVIGSEQYDTKNAPMEKIFGAQDNAYLNLITCNGTWNKQEQNYDKRLVVFTKYDPE